MSTPAFFYIPADALCHLHPSLRLYGGCGGSHPKGSCGHGTSLKDAPLPPGIEVEPKLRCSDEANRLEGISEAFHPLRLASSKGGHQLRHGYPYHHRLEGGRMKIRNRQKILSEDNKRLGEDIQTKKSRHEHFY